MRVPGWLRRRGVDDIAREIDSHVAMATRDYIARGMTPDDARAAATREFGNVLLVRETTREVWSWTRVEHCLQDVKFGARILRHAPGLSAAAILLIALVIGGNATVYSMVNSILVSPASGVNRDDLVVIRHVDPGVAINDPFVSFPNFEDYARSSTTVRDFAAWNGERMTLGTPTGNFAVFGGVVTTNYFDTFGVEIAHGRGLVARDDDAAGRCGRRHQLSRLAGAVSPGRGCRRHADQHQSQTRDDRGSGVRRLRRRRPHAGRRFVAAHSSVLPIDQQRSRVQQSRAAVRGDGRPSQSISIDRRGALRVRERCPRNCKAVIPTRSRRFRRKAWCRCETLARSCHGIPQRRCCPLPIWRRCSSRSSAWSRS